MSDLAPCPFCWDDDHLRIAFCGETAHVECENCGGRGSDVAMPDDWPTLDEAALRAIVAKEWNEEAAFRLAEEALSGELARAKALIASANEIIASLVWHAEHPGVRHKEHKAALRDAHKYLGDPLP